MDENMRDYIVVSNDEGDELELDVIGYFMHTDKEGNEREFAILCDTQSEENDSYIMEVVQNPDDDTEEFIPISDEMFDELAEIAENILAEDDECGCGCDHDHEDGECCCGHDHEGGCCHED